MIRILLIALLRPLRGITWREFRQWFVVVAVTAWAATSAVALAIFVAYLLSACGGDGGDNKRGTGVANDKDKQEQAK